MKQLFYKTTINTLLVLMTCVAFGQNKVSKEIKETARLSNNGQLFIENKYGDVFIDGWTRETIEITVEIEAKGRNLEKAKELLNRINPEIETSGNVVMVKSHISEREQGFFSRYIKKVDAFNAEKTNTNINYRIYLPKRAEIEVINKYGDVVITNWEGTLKADVEHGDLRITDAISNANISIKYGHLKASSLSNVSINAKSGTLTIDASDRMKLESDGSEIRFEDIKNLELYSNKDNIDVTKVGKISGDIKYSTVALDSLVSKANLELHLAELRVRQCSEVPTLNINQNTSEVYVNIANSNFDFTAKLEQGVLRIPKTMKNIVSKVIDEKNKVRNVKANYGTANQGIIDVVGYKGLIILKEL
ncbi:DUF4097 domain-containing protein [Seonamhaeicola marinus]|uniref:DUF4097 domain-containing protein n=1 Tax=Seonamhaeicola marinus TaxID=1912246 RepID=A0A5D0HT65_9FLAO|nr:DUF4097 domain-containing protein [Seonamhaeicola marinus]TYA74160.1 DUF4097 domain-containing protein [Seonamhaeicola marinus]